MSNVLEECLFHNLPTELIVKFINFVGLKEKKVMRLVCGRWCCILDDRMKFNVVIDGNDSVKIQNFLKTGLKIHNVTFKNVTQANWPYPTRTRNHFPRIRTATLESGNSEDVLLAFLSRFGRQNLESLRLREYSFLNCDIRKMISTFRGLEWENLCELKLSLGYCETIHIMYLEQLHHSIRRLFKKYFISLRRFLESVTAPKLRKFILKYNDMGIESYTEEQFKPFFPIIYGFINRHSKTLKVLDWSIRSYLVISDTLEGWEISTASQEKISRDLKLESLSIRFEKLDLDSQSSRVNLVFPCIWGSTGLKSLTCDLDASRFDWWGLAHDLCANNNCVLNKIEETIRLNAPTLEDVSIPLLSTGRLNLFKNFQKLRKLTLKTYEVTFNDMDSNLDLSLPTVTHLELISFFSTLPLNFDEWVVRIFKNLEKIHIFLLGTPLYVNDRWAHAVISVPILQNLLRLPRLKDLRESHTRSTYRNQYYRFDPEIKVFCAGSAEADAVLSYEIKQFPCIPKYHAYYDFYWSAMTVIKKSEGTRHN